MAEIAEHAHSRPAAPPSAWGELIRKEDWWAIWIGLGLVAVAIALFANGSSIKWIAVAPQKWSHLSNAAAQLQQHGAQYAALFVLWAVSLGIGAAALGFKLSRFLPAFLTLYVVAGAIYFLGLWDQSAHYNLEPPLVALLVGYGHQDVKSVLVQRQEVLISFFARHSESTIPFYGIPQNGLSARQSRQSSLNGTATTTKPRLRLCIMTADLQVRKPAAGLIPAIRPVGFSGNRLD